MQLRNILISMEAKHELVRPPGSRASDRADDGDLLCMSATLRKNGSVATRGPGPSRKRGQQQAALVYERDDRPLADGVFFTRGHSFLIHVRMAVSSLSIARRTGF